MINNDILIKKIFIKFLKNKKVFSSFIKYAKLQVLIVFRDKGLKIAYPTHINIIQNNENDNISEL